MHQELQRAISLTELAPSPLYSNRNVHVVDSNVFAKFDEIPSFPFKILRKNQNVVDKELERTITLTELAPSPFFYCKGSPYGYQCVRKI